MPVEQVVLDKRLIFTVTPGRSGTSYLAKLLGTIPNVSAHHEPSPNPATILRRVQQDPSAAYQFLYEHKLPAIKECPTEIYAETTHLFCKGFIEPMVRMGLRPSLIILRRPPREVALSHVIGSIIPARSSLGAYYLLDPRDPGVIPLFRWEWTTDYQLCFWYALEMERRQLRYAQMALELGLPVFDVTNTELNDWNIYSRMLQTLGLPVTEEVRASHASISTARHNKHEHPREVRIINSLDYEEESIWDMASHFEPLLYAHIIKRYGSLARAA